MCIKYLCCVSNHVYHFTDAFIGLSLPIHSPALFLILSIISGYSEKPVLIVRVKLVIPNIFKLHPSTLSQIISFE